MYFFEISQLFKLQTGTQHHKSEFRTLVSFFNLFQLPFLVVSNISNQICFRDIKFSLTDRWSNHFGVSFTGDLLDASINRSPSAYLNNPEAERKKYKYDVDKDMTLIKFEDDEWGPIGSFNWFATHGTSMSRTNSLISGDNKGAAARFMEDWFEQNTHSLQLDQSMFDKIPRRVSNIVDVLHDDRKCSVLSHLHLSRK